MILQDGVTLGQCVGSSLGLMKMFRQNWTLFTATLPGRELLKVEKIAIRFRCGDSGHYPITVPSPINSLCNTRCKQGLERRGCCEHVAVVHFPVHMVACGLGVRLFSPLRFRHSQTLTVLFLLIFRLSGEPALFPPFSDVTRLRYHAPSSAQITDLKILLSLPLYHSSPLFSSPPLACLYPPVYPWPGVSSAKLQKKNAPGHFLVSWGPSYIFLLHSLLSEVTDVTLAS